MGEWRLKTRTYPPQRFTFLAPETLGSTPQPPCASLVEPMLTDAVIAPLTEEDGTFEDVDPEEGHEDNLTLHDGSRQRLTSGEARF